MTEASTQAHLPIADIVDGVVTLTDGSAALILQTTAVNFDLLSEKEQLAIIAAFAAFLNSLSFPIQIIIRSKRLDISNYLAVLSAAQTRQTNPQLLAYMRRFQAFLNTIIRDNEVLDKQFYIAIPVSYLELGLISSRQQRLQKALTILNPRRDHVLRQLARIGLKATQLSSDQLIRLFYDLYNEGVVAQELPPTVAPQPTQPSPIPTLQLPTSPPTPSDLKPPPTPAKPGLAPISSPPPVPPVPPPVSPPPPIEARPIHPATPFVVEELPDDYGAI